MVTSTDQSMQLGVTVFMDEKVFPAASFRSPLRLAHP
jgi:hypothetical protein